MKQALAALWAAVLIGLLGFLHTLQARLPEKIPTHFDFRGVANAWASKETFLPGFTTLVLAVNALLFLLAVLIRRLPPSLINWPDKEYWFATAERRDLVYDRIQAVMSCVGIFVDTTFLFCSYIILQESGAKVPWHVPVNIGMAGILGLAGLLIPVSFLFTRKPRE